MMRLLCLRLLVACVVSATAATAADRLIFCFDGTVKDPSSAIQDFEHTGKTA